MHPPPRFALPFLLLALIGCNDASVELATEPVELDFAVTVGGRPFECGATYDGVGAAAGSLVPSEMKLFVHDVELLDRNGEVVRFDVIDDGAWQHSGVVLLDFENGTEACQNGSAAINTRIVGRVEPGRDIETVRFRVGVPESLNHANAALAPAPLSTTTMWWSWLTGYKFVRIDARTAEGEPFLLHLGSTECAGKVGVDLRCERPNRPLVELDGIEPGTSVIELDLAELFAGVDLALNTPDTEPGCMSSAIDPECEPIFEALGLSFESGLPEGDAYAFRVR